MIHVKKATKIVIYQENKILLFYHLTKTCQGCSIASAGRSKVLGQFLLGLSYFIAVVWESCDERIN